MHVLITLQTCYWACFILVLYRNTALPDLGLRTNLMNSLKLRALQISCFEGLSSEQLGDAHWKFSPGNYKVLPFSEQSHTPYNFFFLCKLTIVK
jgi:hypothetical protein